MIGSETNSQDKVRLVFINKNEKWSSMPQSYSPFTNNRLRKINSLYPTNIILNTTENNIKIKASKINSSYECDVGAYSISTMNSDMLKPNLYDFEIWPGKYKYIPVVLSSHDINKDIKNGIKWIDTTLSSTEMERLLTALKDSIDIFSINNSLNKTPKVIRALRSQNDELLVSISGGNWNSDSPSHMRAFYLTKDSVNFLGEDLFPLDYGDFNLDGKIEWIFIKSGYNNDGYVLYENNFQKKISYNWIYH
jgi:hypothetical protein